MNINEDNIYKFGTEDLLLRTNEALVDATKNLNEATGNLVTSSGNLDKSILRLANVIIAENGLLARYAGIDPTRLAQIAAGEHGVFNESDDFNLYDTENDLEEMSRQYATSTTSEEGEEIISNMSLWTTTLDAYYTKSEQLFATKAELEAWSPEEELAAVATASGVVEEK
jgi:hypothetical protein